MKKYVALFTLLTSINIYAWTIPISVPLKVGYTHSTSEKEYRGMEIGSNIPVYRFTETANIGVEPFIYFMNSFKNIDPGILFTLNKTVPLNDRYGLIFSLGAGGMYFGYKKSDQNVGFNFIEKAEVGIYRKLDYGITVSLKAAGWHISDAGMRGHGNPGLNGYKILLGFQKKI